MQDAINIADFNESDRFLLLEYLWENTKDIIEPNYEFNIETAKMQLNYNGGYAHVVCGRKIEMYLFNVNTLDPYLYDFHNGDGSVRELVYCVRDVKYDETIEDVEMIDNMFNQVKIK